MSSSPSSSSWSALIRQQRQEVEGDSIEYQMKGSLDQSSQLAPSTSSDDGIHLGVKDEENQENEEKKCEESQEQKENLKETRSGDDNEDTDDDVCHLRHRIEHRDQNLDASSSLKSSSCFRLQSSSSPVSSSSLTKTATVDDDSLETYSSAASKVFGGRFSKSPEERVRILSQRKEDLIRVARQSFLMKQRMTSKDDKKKE